MLDFELYIYTFDYLKPIQYINMMRDNHFEGEKRGKEYQAEYSFDERIIKSKQCKLEFILDKSTKDCSVTDYDTVKHKGVSYNIGDTVEIFSTQINTTYVAKLKRIVKVPTSFEKLPFVEVQWYIKKNDLPKSLLDKYGEHISEAQVFPSENFHFCLYIQSIKCKCFVLTEDQYSKLIATYEYYYFTRANYLHQEEALVPSPEFWKKDCICQMPVNPDLVYIQCGKCQKWFHDKCAEYESLSESYICPNCSYRDEHKL